MFFHGIKVVTLKKVHATLSHKLHKTLDKVHVTLSVGIGANLGFNAQENTKKTLNTSPFGNTCKADVVSPEVEAGVVAELRCL
jgi:hypothetical protein